MCLKIFIFLQFRQLTDENVGACTQNVWGAKIEGEINQRAKIKDLQFTIQIRWRILNIYTPKQSRIKRKEDQIFITKKQISVHLIHLRNSNSIYSIQFHAVFIFTKKRRGRFIYKSLKKCFFCHCSKISLTVPFGNIFVTQFQWIYCHN